MRTPQRNVKDLLTAKDAAELMPQALRDDLRHATETVARIKIRPDNQLEGRRLRGLELKNSSEVAVGLCTPRYCSRIGRWPPRCRSSRTARTTCGASSRAGSCEPPRTATPNEGVARLRKLTGDDRDPEPQTTHTPEPEYV